MECVLEIEIHLGVMILAASAEAVLLLTAAPHLSEQLGKEVREIGRFTRIESTVGEFEAGIPVRWWSEILSRPVALAQLIVGGALIRIGQHSVGFVDLLHALFGVRFLRDVRVVFAGQFAEGFLDVGSRGIPRHAENAVIVLILHASPPQ